MLLERERGIGMDALLASSITYDICVGAYPFCMKTGNIILRLGMVHVPRTRSERRARSGLQGPKAISTNELYGFVNMQTRH